MTNSNANARVLVTRPAGQSDRLVDVLADAGIVSSCLPMLSLDIVTEASKCEQIKKQLHQLDQQDFAIFISSNAVKYTAEFLEQDNKLKWPSTLPCIPIGGATAQAICDLGWPLDKNVSDDSEDLAAYSSEKLLEQLSQRDVSGKRISIFRGEGGRELLAKNLSARGAIVDYCEMYQRQHPDYSSEAIKRVLGVTDNRVDDKLAAILFASGETLDNFYRHIERDQLQIVLESVPVIVPSERIQVLAAAYGFKKIHIAVNASAEGFLKVIKEQVIR
ncbi:MAG: uroporphyrinogen-III synthase [Pseudomonadales bacterium]